MPIISSDAIAITDLLERRIFAKNLVTSLTRTFSNRSESFVIGINGAWGSGKSTLLSFIQEEIHQIYQNDNDKYKIINFNPWATSSIDEQELERIFLEVLIKDLQSIKWKNKISDKNDIFKSYLKYLNYLRFVKHVHPVAEKIIDSIEEYTNKSTIHTIDEVKKQADKLLAEKDIKLYIFLDDLDRLTSQEVAAIFKVIKLNANFINTCYIIAYDKTVVSEALNELFNNKGIEYLEKIIQVDFSVPEINDENLENIYFQGLRDLLNTMDVQWDEDGLLKVWKFYGLKEYFRTLRDVKRYLNSLLLSLPNITIEINITDFVVLEAIKVFDYNAYQKIFNDFLVIQRKAVWGGTSAFDNTTINEYSNVTTKSLLEYLFVQKGSITQLMRGSLNSKNLYDPVYFKRYYTLHISSTDVSQDTLTQFLLIGKNREQILNDAVENGQIKNLLTRLSDFDLSKFYTVQDVYILESFLRFWDKNGYKITYELDEYLWHCYFNLAHSLQNKHEGAKVAIENLILREEEHQPLRFIFNYFIILFHEEDRSDKQLRDNIKDQINLVYPTLFSAFIQHISKQWHTYIWNAIRNEDDHTGFLFLLSFAKYVPGEYQKALEKYFSGPRFIIFLVKRYFLKIDQNDKPFSIDLSKKEILLPGSYWGKFITYLRTAKKGAWDETNQKYVTYFLNGLKEINEK